MANNLAVNVPELKAAVAFYGRQPALEDVPKIKAAVQLHYAGMDERINEGIGAYEDALKKAGVNHEVYIYTPVCNMLFIMILQQQDIMNLLLNWHGKER
jgi:carboxymethylenebutenolidase